MPKNDCKKQKLFECALGHHKMISGFFASICKYCHKTQQTPTQKMYEDVYTTFGARRKKRNA